MQGQSPVADPPSPLAQGIPAVAHLVEEPNRCHQPAGRCAGNFDGPHKCTWNGRKLTISCTTCNKVFSRKSDFNRHYKNVHDPARTLHHCPFPDCNRVFKRRDNVIPHRRSAHGEIVDLPKAPPP